MLAQPSLTFALGDYLYSHQYTNVTVGALHLYDSCFLSLHFCSIGRPIPLSLSLSMCVSCVGTCFSIARIWVEYLVLNFSHISLFEVTYNFHLHGMNVICGNKKFTTIVTASFIFEFHPCHLSCIHMSTTFKCLVLSFWVVIFISFSSAL